MYIKNHFYWFLPGTLHFVIIVKSDITPGFIYHTADQKRRSIMDLFGFLYKIEELNNNPDSLCRKLTSGGIELKDLINRIRDWCQPADSVIPAPKKLKHFNKSDSD